jgi:hypothetical protein
LIGLQCKQAVLNVFRQERLIICQKHTISAFRHPHAVIFIIYLAKETLVAAYRHHAWMVARVFDRCVPGAIVGSIVNQDYLKICQNLLIENAVKAMPEILPVVIVNQDTDHRIIGIVDYGDLVHRG